MDIQTVTDAWMLVVAKTGALGVASLVTVASLVVLAVGDLVWHLVVGIRRWFRVRAIRRMLNQIKHDAYVVYRSGGL